MSQRGETLTASDTEQQSDELKNGTNVSLVIYSKTCVKRPLKIDKTYDVTSKVGDQIKIDEA